MKSIFKTAAEARRVANKVAVSEDWKLSIDSWTDHLGKSKIFGITYQRKIAGTPLYLRLDNDGWRCTTGSMLAGFQDAYRTPKKAIEAFVTTMRQVSERTAKIAKKLSL